MFSMKLLLLLFALYHWNRRIYFCAFLRDDCSHFQDTPQTPMVQIILLFWYYIFGNKVCAFPTHVFFQHVANSRINIIICWLLTNCDVFVILISLFLMQDIIIILFFILSLGPPLANHIYRFYHSPQTWHHFGYLPFSLSILLVVIFNTNILMVFYIFFGIIWTWWSIWNI